MKWHGILGTQTAKRCCFCEYWAGELPKMVLKAKGGMFEYEEKDKGLCRHPSYYSKQVCAGSRCAKFVLNPHIH